MSIPSLLRPLSLCLAVSVVGAACTSVPIRERDASQDAGSTMDAELADRVVPDTAIAPPTDVAVPTDTTVPDSGGPRPDAGAPDVPSPPDAAVDSGPSCPLGQTLCNGSCVDTRTSTAHCGSCGNACPARANAAVSCAASSCTFACNTNFADCDRATANGCEATLDTAMNCGACGTACTGATPICDALMRRCTSGCSAPAMRCGGTCVDVTTSVSNCGMCGRVCSLPNATASCAAGACAIATCNAGFADCDRNPANGCEVNLQTDLANCGMCARACASGPNSTASCSAGVCGLSCLRGFGNCNANAADGCEVSLTTTSNCNACGRVCAPGANATPTCNILTGCGITCATGFGNCNGNSADGCEASFSRDAANCGACGTNCGASGICRLGACMSCAAPTTPCGSSCIDTNTDVNNCGACGYVCPTAPAGFTAECVVGRCYYGLACDPRMGDCDRDRTNGFETNTDSSMLNCGACGRACGSGSRCCNGGCRLIGQSCLPCA